MMPILIIPDHIAATGIQRTPIRHKWDDKDPESSYSGESRRLEQQIVALSPRAALALACGISEWILWRFQELELLSDAVSFVEAVWAGIIDFRYASEWTKPSDIRLDGPILGPQWIAAKLLGEVWSITKRRGAPSAVVGYLCFLGEHVVPAKAKYKDWLKSMLTRLGNLYPKSDATRAYLRTTVHSEQEIASFDWGVPVPRRALNPGIDWHLDLGPSLLNKYLQCLDYTKNRFLSSPDEMRKLGFHGIPYRYQLATPEERLSDGHT